MSRAAQYAALFTKGGRTASIERQVANSSPTTVNNVRVRIRNFSAEEVAGGVTIGQRKVLVLAEDVTSIAPLKSGDVVIVDSSRFQITEKPDDQTHRDGATLLAYDCVCS